MPRAPRIAAGGVIFHVLNRAVGRRTVFMKGRDYHAFERAIAHALEVAPLQILAYCLMPNHWHLLVCPRGDRDLGRFMHQLTNTHTRRWHEHHQEVGLGHLYQDRFKSFPVQDDEHFLTVARYIERNPLRAHLVDRAENWPWSSLWRRTDAVKEVGLIEGEKRVDISLAKWPVDSPKNCIAWINKPQTLQELESVRKAISSARPYGQPHWQQMMISRAGMKSSRGRL